MVIGFLRKSEKRREKKQKNHPEEKSQLFLGMVGGMEGRLGL